MLKRKIYKELLKWKNSEKKKALMIKGARQVGKTFIIREFGNHEYASFIEINFIKQPQLKNIFVDDLTPDVIYKKMTMFLDDIKLIPGKTLIFLDEIQNCGDARTAIKFLVEDGKFDIISSGSLLGLTYAENGDKDYEEPESIPVGYEKHLMMYSLDFEEFLLAEGYSETQFKILKEYFDNKSKVPDVINEKYEQLFREYIIVGGMPEVVADYVTNHDFNSVADIQKAIIDNYKLDISKHAKGKEKIKVQKCYDSIPVQLAKEIKKFQYSTIEKKSTSKKYGGSVQWLKDSCLVNLCTNVINPYIPLSANIKSEQFKLYVNDTGLLCELYGKQVKQAILSNTIKGNVKGGIYENIIAESLLKKGYELYYYKPDDDNELEFLIEKDGQVIPVEVKSGNTATVSLNRFIDKYNPPYVYKFVLGNVGVIDEKITLPHYMIMFI